MGGGGRDRLGGICCGIAAVQRSPKGDSACGHRHERRLHKRHERPPWQRSGGVHKFHVIENLVDACDQVRKAEKRAGAGKRDWLGRTRWMWLKNQVNWTEKEAQKWESKALERCVTGMAYQMRLVSQCIYELKDAEDARMLFRNWCAWVHSMRERTGDLPKSMARTARMIAEHLLGIFGPLDSRPEDRHHGRARKPVISREAAATRIPDSKIYNGHALLRRRET